MDQPNIVVHDKLEPPIKRRLTADILWDKFSFYDESSNTIHIIDPKTIIGAFTQYHRAYAEKLHSRKIYRAGLISPARVMDGIILLMGAFLASMIIGVMWNISALAQLSGLILIAAILAPMTWFVLRILPRDFAAKTARRYLKNPI